MKRRYVTILLGVLIVGLPMVRPLPAAAANYEPFTMCCYVGALTRSSVDSLVLTLDDGSEARFQELFPDYRPQTGWFKRALAFRQARIALVQYRALREVMALYDANENTVIEGPELATLYIREAALGLGHPVSADGLHPAGALALPQAELGGLVLYVERNVERMTTHAQAVFRGLERLEHEIRTQSDSGHGDFRSSDLMRP